MTLGCLSKRLHGASHTILDLGRNQHALALHVPIGRICIPEQREEGEEVLEGVSEKAPLQIDDRTRKLVESSSYLAFTQNEARVVCTLTGHEVKPDYMDILKYLSSKKVQRLLEHGPFDIEVMALGSTDERAAFQCDKNACLLFVSSCLDYQRIVGVKGHPPEGAPFLRASGNGSTAISLDRISHR